MTCSASAGVSRKNSATTSAADGTCKLTELHRPAHPMGKITRREEIAAQVNSCEAGGIRFGADNTPVFVR